MQEHILLYHCPDPCWKHHVLTRKRMPVLYSGIKRQRISHKSTTEEPQQPMFTLVCSNVSKPKHKRHKVLKGQTMMKFFFNFSLLPFISLHHH